MKTLRVTLSDIVGGTGGSGSTAEVRARYVTGDTNLNQNVSGIADGSVWSCTSSYITDEPWPTTLPGTAV